MCYGRADLYSLVIGSVVRYAAGELIVIGSADVGEKSSHYGLDMLGYTCATKVNTVGRDGEI